MDNLTSQPVDMPLLAKRMLLGAAVGLVLISLFLYGAPDPKPEWGKYWSIRPMVIVPLAGAMGGLFYYFMVNYLKHKKGWQKGIAIALSLVVCLIGLWMGFVLGLDGTWWD
jgi:H+/Cl- antiporter ClcA